MALPTSKTDRDYQKFRDGSVVGQTKVAVSVEGDTGILQGVEYDEIQATYPSPDVELYTYFKSAIEVASVEVTYTDNTKQTLLSVKRV